MPNVLLLPEYGGKKWIFKDYSDKFCQEIILVQSVNQLERMQNTTGSAIQAALPMIVGALAKKRIYERWRRGVGWCTRPRS